jgi:hypothetical protein
LQWKIGLTEIRLKLHAEPLRRQEAREYPDSFVSKHDIGGLLAYESRESCEGKT